MIMVLPSLQNNFHGIPDLDVLTNDEFIDVSVRLDEMQIVFREAIDFRKAREFPSPLEQINIYTRTLCLTYP